MLQDFRRKRYSSNIYILLYLLTNLWFHLLERYIIIPQNTMYHPIDDLISFAPVFIIPYYIWYFYLAIPLIYFYFKSPKDFNKLMIFTVISMAVACFVYSVYPNGQLLRPNITSTDPLSKWVAFTYLKDTPNNSAPSIHVLFSIGTHVAIANYPPFKRYSIIKRISTILMMLICMSTVFVKQHSIIDSAVAVPLGYFLYRLIYRRKSTEKSFATQF